MAAAGAARDTGFRCVLRDREQLDALAREPLPAGLRESARAAGWHRDIYFDTADGALRGRGAVCRLRHRADGRTILSLFLDGGAGAGSRPERMRSPAKPSTSRLGRSARTESPSSAWAPGRGVALASGVIALTSALPAAIDTPASA